MPIGFLYAGTLWLGNAAYIYLSVSFIQMLKVGLARCRGLIQEPGSAGAGTPAQLSLLRCFPPSLQASMPVAVFAVGCMFGTEHFTVRESQPLLHVSASCCVPGTPSLGTGAVSSSRRWMSSYRSPALRLTLPCSAAAQHAGNWHRHLYCFVWRCAGRQQLQLSCQTSHKTADVRSPLDCPDALLVLATAEINFVWIGVLLQMASVATESTRLTLVQILLQVGPPGALSLSRLPCAAVFANCRSLCACVFAGVGCSCLLTL